MLGVKLWLEVEEEFKREIGAENYNKEGWMKNKPALYKIIKKHQKKNPKASINSVETANVNENDDSGDEIDIDVDGVVLKVQPRFKGAGTTWKQNFAKKFNLQQNGNNRWQRRTQQQNQQQQPFQNKSNNRFNNNSNRNNSRNNNNVDQRKSGPSADSKWKCAKCRDEGVTRELRGDQKCPIHKWRPSWFKNIPCVNEIKPDEENHDENVVDNNGQLAAIRTCMHADAFRLYNEED